MLHGSGWEAVRDGKGGDAGVDGDVDCRALGEGMQKKSLLLASRSRSWSRSWSRFEYVPASGQDVHAVEGGGLFPGCFENGKAVGPSTNWGIA